MNKYKKLMILGYVMMSIPILVFVSPVVLLLYMFEPWMLLGVAIGLVLLSMLFGGVVVVSYNQAKLEMKS